MKKVVFTNGCFDLLHEGHVSLIKYAKSLGDELVVGLNSDYSIQKIKGLNRPINNQSIRKLILESFRDIDKVILFDDETPYELIKEIKPDLLVKGGDYKPDQIIGSDIVKETIIFPYKDGKSSTSIIQSCHDSFLRNHSSTKFMIDSITSLIKSSKLIEESAKEISGKVLNALKNKGKIITFGNGGSASDSEHLTAELMIRYKKNRISIPSICLNSMTSSITACANDFGYEHIFERQLSSILNNNDVVIGFSTSGKSLNVINALNFASRKIDLANNWLITGSGSPPYENFSMVPVKSNNTAVIQQIHIHLIHLICEIIDSNL